MKRLKRLISTVLVMVLVFTATPLSIIRAQAAETSEVTSSKLPTSYQSSDIGALSDKYSTGELWKLKITTRTDETTFCVELGIKLGGTYTATTASYGTYEKYMKAAFYYEQIATSSAIKKKDARYILAQMLSWRILQLRERGVIPTVANITASEFKTAVMNIANKQLIPYYGLKLNSTEIWNDLVGIIKRGANDEFKDKVELTTWICGKYQKLVTGLAAEEQFANIDLQKTGTNTGSAANLKGAVYGIYADAKCKTLVTKLTTNAKGYAKSANVMNLATTYYAKEINAPTGTKLDSTVYNITTKRTEGATTRVNAKTVSNDEADLTINVLKEDKTGNVLAGTVFTIYEWSASSSKYLKVKTITTGTNGKATSGKLYYTSDNKGKFKITETTATTGYVNSGWSREISLGTSKTLTKSYTVSNASEMGVIEITKKGTVTGTKANIGGAVFGIYDNINCTIKVAQVTTNANGYGKSTNLPVGKYYVKEITAPMGTNVNKTVYPIEIKAGQTSAKYAVTIPNEEWNGTVSVLKTDIEDSSNVLKGTVFTIHEWNGSSYVKNSTITTDANGKATSGTLYYSAVNKGKFKIAETTATSGYDNSGWTKEFTLTKSAQTFGYTVTNQKAKGDVQITKGAVNIGGEAANALYEGVQYTIYKSFDGSIFSDAAGTIVLDASGIGKSEKINAGTYYLVETKANDSFAGDLTDVTRSIKFTINGNQTTLLNYKKGVSYDNGSTYAAYLNANDKTISSSVTMGNSLKNALLNIQKTIDINVVKLSESDNSRLKNAEFILYQWSKCQNKYVEAQTVTTDYIGTAEARLYYTADNLGKFKIKESKAPDGYENSGWTKEFTFADATAVSYTYADVGTEGYKGTYNADVTYNYLDWVSIAISGQEKYYQSLADYNTSIYPSSDNAKWREMTFSYGTGEALTYKNGYVLLYASNFYKLMHEDSGNKAAPPNVGYTYTDGTLIYEQIGAAPPTAPSAISTYNSLFKLHYDVTNKLETNYANITIQKENANTGSLIPGATFKAYAENGSEYGEFTDNGDGTYSLRDIVVEGLGDVKFTIKETDVPYGYVEYSDNTKQFTLTVTVSKENKNLLITVEEEPVVVNIKGVKKDADTNTATAQGDATLKGALYGLYETKTGTIALQTAVTNEKGEFSFSNLTLKDYYIKEIKAPEGYELSTDVYKVTAADIYDGSQNTTVVNVDTSVTDTVMKSPVKIKKYSQTKEQASNDEKFQLGGAGFKLFLISALSSSLDITDLEAMAQYDFTNETPVAITSDGKTEIFTDADGKAVTADIPYGTYVVVESTVPYGYLKADPQIVIIGGNISTISLEFNDQTYEAPIKILKYDEETHELLTITGTIFKVFDVANGKYLTETVEVAVDGKEDEYETIEQDIIFEADENGIVYTDLLTTGTYRVEEVECAKGYNLTNKTVTVEIGTDREPSVDSNGGIFYEIEFTNKAIWVEFGKTDATTGVLVAGAHLELYSADDELIDEWVTDETAHKIKGLAPGMYRLVETAAPEGYLIAEEIEFEVIESIDLQKVGMQDDYTKLRIKKTDIVTRKEIPGAILQILTPDGEVISEWKTDGEEKVIDYLPIGDYILREITAPDGYLIAPDIEFTVEETGELQIVEMQDDVTKVLVHKLELDSTDYIAGAKMQVLDSNGKVVLEFVTVDEAYYITKLPVGKYILHELEPPTGYSFAPDVEFEVEETYEVQEVTMEDAPTRVVISKEDMTTGESLDGAELQIIDENGNVVEEWTTLGETSVTIDRLPAGKYTLVEKSAPLGYVIAESVEFEVINDGSITKVAMKDDFTKVAISKYIDGTEKYLAGAKLQLIKDGEVIDEWNTGDTAKYYEKLAVGNYVLSEVSAPNGYDLADDICFRIENKGGLQEIVMFNTISKMNLARPGKTGDKIPLVWYIILTSSFGFGIMQSQRAYKNKYKKKL